MSLLKELSGTTYYQTAITFSLGDIEHAAAQTFPYYSQHVLTVLLEHASVVMHINDSCNWYTYTIASYSSKIPWSNIFMIFTMITNICAIKLSRQQLKLWDLTLQHHKQTMNYKIMRI